MSPVGRHHSLKCIHDGVTNDDRVPASSRTAIHLESHEWTSPIFATVVT